MNRSWVVIASPSIPTTSMTCVMRRMPSRMRLTCAIRWTAAAIWVRTAREGRLMPDMPTMFSSRVSASRGVLAWIVRHRAVVAGVHRLQHVERFVAADLAEDDAVGAHAQRVLQQVAHRDLAGALEVGRAGLEPHDMRLLQLQFGGVLDRHGALGRVDHPRQGVEQRRLARAGAAGDQDVEPAARGDLQQRRHLPARCWPAAAIVSRVIDFLENLRIEMSVRRSPAAG